MCIRYPYSYKPEDIIQTGAAQEGRAGFPNNPVTIVVSEAYYKYIIALPAVMRNLCDMSVDVLPNGDVKVEGMVRPGEITSAATPIIFNRTRRIFPNGHFTINFTFPGPVDPEFVIAKVHSNGVLDGVVLRRIVNAQPKSSD